MADEGMRFGKDTKKACKKLIPARFRYIVT